LHFKKAQKDEKQKQQKIKNDELLNKVASRRDFLRGKYILHLEIIYQQFYQPLFSVA
jgi:hypothetical protein